MNVLFDGGRAGFLDGQVSWSQNTIRAVLIDVTRYQVDLANHQWLSDVTAGAIVSTSGPFSGKTITAGVANASPITFTSVSGPLCSALVIYRDTGVASTSRLIAYMTQAVGLPAAPDGGNIIVSWDSGPRKIFVL